MRNSCRSLLSLWMALLGGAGCAEKVLSPSPSMLPPNKPYMYSDLDWAQILRQHVHDGLVDYAGLVAGRDALERYYALLSVTGPARTPEQFTSREQKTAYWINAYNACVLRAVLERYPTLTMYDVTLPRLESDYKFVIDGQVLKLLDLEQEMFKTSEGDVRILFAASRAARGTPALLNEPLRASTLERQLTAAAERALENPHLLQIDHGTRTIYLWQKILQRQGDFIEYWRTRRRGHTVYLYNVLCELASPSQRRMLKSAVGYTLKEMPFYRELNGLNPPAEPR